MVTKDQWVKAAAGVLALMLVFVIFQAYWIAQLEIPYFIRGLLALSGGMAFGYAVSVLFFVWHKGNDSLQ
jgi:ABC-type xylose transport system permease subunit